MKKYNYILSVIVIVIASAGLYITTTFHTVSSNANDPGGAFWPRMLLVGLILCALGLIVQSALAKPESGSQEAPLIDYKSAGVHCVLIIFAIMVAYAVALYFFGFIPATLFFVVATMLAMGERKVLKIGLTTVCVTGSIYLMFATLMGVILPQGIIF
ncbi:MULTISPECIES: tripartite tricarboxylate transporter TctB family protein [Acutalibacteraceae]|uniref:tripartite tricarboxylate transporter TctB family protein n=1 Tax=Acutalibacteraceae TaxID=3082771 RepID=UPI0013E8B774|nr:MULTISPECIES: tripartite tricarboxylate transporter TctB family protein [Acutalibacteraceae]